MYPPRVISEGTKIHVQNTPKYPTKSHHKYVYTEYMGVYMTKVSASQPSIGAHMVSQGVPQNTPLNTPIHGT